MWRANASSVDELVQNVFDQYEEYDGDTLERVWQSLFKVYNQTLRKLGDNDFRVEHTGVGKRQRDGTLETVVNNCLLYTSPSPRDATLSRMPSSA